MDFIQLVVLALVQGLTEFLPVSSSAHLILAPVLLGWKDQGLIFDLAVHLGSLVAVVWYFRDEIRRMAFAWFQSFTGTHSSESRLAWAVIIGTIPAGLFGLAFKDIIETQLRSPLVIAASTAVFGLLLLWADRAGKQQRDEYSITTKDAIFIGIGQAFALIPGTSRSGATMTAGLFLGLNREAAARFSFLLSIPIIVLASLFLTLDVAAGETTVEWLNLAIAVVLSAMSAYACIAVFLKLISKVGMLPFVVYRLLLAAFLFVVFW